MRSYIASMALLTTCLMCVAADAVGNWTNLQTLVFSAAVSMDPYENSTYMRNLTLVPSLSIVDWLANITTTILLSKAVLDTNQAAFVNNSTLPMDDAYLVYVDTLPTLAAAIQGRGMEWHLQLNYPVYAAVKALASAVHAYGTDLRAHNVTSSASVIPEIWAGSALTDAQRAWARILNLPGRSEAIFV